MRNKRVLLCVLALTIALIAMSAPSFAAENVAKINETEYATLEEAFAEALDGDTIIVLADCEGNGIIVPQGKYNTTGLTVDFGGHTYTVSGNLVGSTGTETNAFQLLKDNKITFKDGTITSTKAKILVQNYSNLTLDNMTLTLNNPNYSSAYTLSNNNGNVVIEDTTINANPAGGFAFDVCRYASYPSVNVTVKGTSVINGDVEVSASKGEAKDGFSLTLESGEMTGEVVIANSAATAMEAAPEKAAVTQEDGFKIYVAEIGTTKYETLEAAFAAAVDGDTIIVLADCEGNGIKVPQGKYTTGLTVDFGGHTYEVTGTPVGSTGTETIGFQLLKDNKITFANGTLTGNSRTNQQLVRLIQNYSDLTLDNMTVGMVGSFYDQTTVSTCNGEFVVKDSTVSAPDFTWANISDPSSVGGAAFAIGTFSTYTAASAEVKGNSTINGDISVGPSNDATNALILTSGTVTGDILMASEQAADATVAKANTFTQAAPAGYEWVDNGDGTSELAPASTVTVSIADIDSYVDEMGIGYLRFVSKVNFTSADTIEYYGTWFIPENLLGESGYESRTVKIYDPIENGGFFNADLLEIPYIDLNRPIAGVSFVKAYDQDEISTSVETASVNEFKNATSAN